MKRRVAVTGLGVITPLGNDINTLWDSLMNGKCAVDEVKRFDTTDQRTHKAAEVKDFDPEKYLAKSRIGKMGKASRFSIAAVKEALSMAGLEGKLVPENTGVMVGTTMGEVQILEKIDSQYFNGGVEKVDKSLFRMYPAHEIAQNIAGYFTAEGNNMTFPNACAAGNYAIGYGFDLIREGELDTVIAGGVDILSQVAFTGFNRLFAMSPDLCRPFDLNRNGMMLSEGAAFLILEDYDKAEKRGAEILAEVAGYGLSCDAHNMTIPQPEGKGAILAMKNALKSSNLTPKEIDYINVHGTSTGENDKVETLAIYNVFKEYAKKVHVSGTKSMYAHLMGGSSALEA
ncbi:MAG: beta-ketoacyl-[acyl-carrier-protein] synthase family protein, partial [Actinomycetia bacterium]|nr:beta-ketoacyl-[acyl-carrier-protein] synthase family protein [Actinomycetes bacterium]